jgi:hypothetical protein
MKVHYFGCGREIGHYWHVAGVGKRLKLDGLDSIDAKYAPRIKTSSGDLTEAPQGHASLTFVNGWTILAYWDRSMDKRPMSNSAFAAKGEFTFEELLSAAREQWPWVFSRQVFDIILSS